MSESESNEIIENLSSTDELNVVVQPKRKLKSKPKKQSAKKKQKVVEQPAIGWMLTHNNYNEEDLVILDEFAAESCKYMIYQQEVGEQGTPHIQCYLELKTKKRMTWILNNLKLSRPPHLEKRREARAACIKYCSKKETRKENTEFVVHGTDGGQGKRNDLTRAVELAKAQAPIQQFVEEIPGTYIRYSKGIEKVQALYSTARDFETKVFIFYGDSGAGKSRLANCFPAVYKAPVSYNGPTWFDRYDPNYHQTVLFDDFYGGIKWTELMQCLDRYGHQVNTKGGFVNFKPKFIVFTSNERPEQWYPKMSPRPQMWAAFQRRIDTVLRFKTHSQGLQIVYEKGDADDFPEGIQVPNSRDPPLQLVQPKQAPKVAPKIIPKRRLGMTQRVQTNHGWVDQPVDNTSVFQQNQHN